MILLFLWTVISSWRYYIVSYSNIRHLLYIMLTLGSVQGSLEAPATCKNGHLVNTEVSEACFSCFFSGILINPFYFCLFCFPIYLFNKTNIFMTLSTYIWQRLVLTGATLFDNFFLVHALKCTFRHPKIQILYYMYLWETSGAP